MGPHRMSSVTLRCPLFNGKRLAFTCQSPTSPKARRKAPQVSESPNLFHFHYLSDLIVSYLYHKPAEDAESGTSATAPSFDEGTEVGLVRLGPTKGRVVLQYKTVVMSAVPGKHYTPVQCLLLRRARKASIRIAFRYSWLMSATHTQHFFKTDPAYGGGVRGRRVLQAHSS